MNHESGRAFALILIGLGVVLLIVQVLGWDMPISSWAVGWPLFLLVPGLFLHATWWGNRRAWYALIPGGLLVVCSLLFFWHIFLGWHWMARLWPVFPLAVAFGLAEAAWAGGPAALLIPAGILGLVGGVALMFTLGGMLLFGLMAIAAGVWLLLPRRTV